MRKPVILIGLVVLGMIAMGSMLLQRGVNRAMRAAAEAEAAAPDLVTARADLRDRDGRSVGMATLTGTEHGVRIEVQVTNLSAGRHGFHIHENGRCEPPDFSSAGGHFNPTSQRHGMENPSGPHGGDLPNIVADKDGNGSLTTVNPYLSLGAGAPNDLLRDGGTSVMIHAGPDDYFTDPAGDSGARIVCGVVERVGE